MPVSIWAHFDYTPRMGAGDDEQISVWYVDNAQSVDGVAAQLERECGRFSVTSTSSPGEVLDSLDVVDCLVSGYRIPEMNGMELLQAVRQTHPELPVILFVAGGSEEVACEAITHDVTEYVRKGETDAVATLAARIEGAVADRSHSDTASTDTGFSDSTTTGITEWGAGEGKLTELDRFSRELVKSAPVALVRLDEDFCATYENPQAQVLFGVPDEEGSLVLESDVRMHPSLVSSGLADKLDLLTEGTTVSLNGWFESVYGTRAYVHGRGVPLFRDGEFDGALLMLIDQTERKQYEEELTRTQELLTSVERLAAVGGWELDRERDEMHWTTGARQIHEVDDEFDPTVENTISFIHPDDRSDVRARIQETAETGCSFTASFRILTAKGNERWVRMRSKALDVEGSGRTIRSVLQDVTEQIESEQQLSVLDRVLRHNLRNDMNVIMARAELLADQVEGKDAELVETILKTAEELLESTEKQREIVHLLSLSHQQSTHNRTLTELLEQSAHRIQERYPEADLTLSLPESHTTAVHPVLERAVIELVENAIRHSDRDVPTVEIRGVIQPDIVEICVADDGPGIPEQEQKVIFGQSEKPLHHASGIGLWLVKWLASRTGSLLTFEKNEPRGSIVRIVIPRDVDTDEEL